MRNAALSLLALFLSTICLAAGHEVTTPILGPSPLEASSPVVASNGETFVTVWVRQGQLFGSIADRTGQRTNQSDISIMPIAPSSSFQLTAVGRDYVLYWADAAGSHLAELAANAHPTKMTALIAIPRLERVSMASDGSEILIVGSTGNVFPPARVVAYLINRDGALMRGPIDIAGFANVRARWSGNEFLIASAEPTGVLLWRVTHDQSTRQQISSASGLFTDPMPVSAAAASSGNETVVIWSESADSVTPFHTVWSAVIGDDGHIVRQQISSSTAGTANIIWNGEAYVATIASSVFRLGRNAMELEPPTDTGRNLSQIASIGDVVYAVGNNGFDPNATVTVLHTSSTIHDMRLEFLSITPASQQEPAIASDGVDFVTTFREQTATTTAVIAAPVARFAVTSVDQPVRIAETTAYVESAIAHGNSVYLVTWADATGVYARRITNQGALLDTEPMRIAANQYPQPLAIAWNGNAFLVAWIGTGGVVAATVSEDGQASPVHRIAPEGSMEPRIAWNGRVFLVIYGVQQPCYFECIPQRLATYGVRVAADGTPIDTNPAAIDLPPNSYSVGAANARVASNGSDFLVALDKPAGAAVVNVKTNGASISVGQPKSIFKWFYFVLNDIAWDGHDYVLASRYSISPTKTWMSLTHVSPAGETLSRGVTATTKMIDAAPPAIASNSLGDSAVVIAEPIGDPAVPRVRAYFDRDFPPAPALPAPPTNVTASGTPLNFTMTWNVGPDAEAVVIETTFGAYSSIEVVPPSVHSHTFSNSSITSVVLRTVNAAGESEAVGALLQTPPRRRVTR